MNFKKIAVLIAVLALILVPISCVGCSDADNAAADDFFIESETTIKISAGVSEDLQIVVRNTGANNHTYLFRAEEIHSDGIDITFSNGMQVLDPEKGFAYVDAHIKVDKYAHKDVYAKSIVFAIVDETGAEYTNTHEINVDVYSAYSSGNMFNKIFGIFAIPGIDSPVVNAAITFVLWILISVGATLLSRLLINIIFKKEEERKLAKNKLGVTWFGIIMIYGLYNTMLVGGADEHVVVVFWDVFQFFYILLVAFIVWNVYKAVIVHFFTRMDKDGYTDDSLVPLFYMIGKIIIICVSVAVFLAQIGVNIAGIITGAGIVGLAVSLGAQNTLTEMFSGFSLMVTRPFIKTDMIRLNDGGDVYEVMNVGLFNTQLKAWGNTTYIYIPNSTVVKSKITNITKTTDVYRIFLFLEMSYESDAEKMKQVLLEAAEKHPRVIKDGTYDKPGVRLSEFGPSGIIFRLAVYVDSFDDNGDIAGELRELIIEGMRNNGVEMPYDKLDVRIERK